MPVPVMLRFDDDVAALLRERAQREHRSINQLVNLAMRGYLQGDIAPPGSALADREQTNALLAQLPDRLEIVRSALKPLARQETQKDYNDKMCHALEALTSCVQLLATAMAPDTVPIVSRAEAQKVHA